MTFQLLQATPSINTVANTPDSAGLSITDNLDLRIRVIVERLAAGNEQTLISKRQGGDEWQFRITAGGLLQLVWWDTGGTPNIETSSVVIPTTAEGTTIWLRTRRSGTSVDFWTSTTDTNDHTAPSWSALGSTQTTPSGSIRSTVATHVNIGTLGNGGGEQLSGFIYAAAIVDNVTTRADPVFASSSEWTVGETGAGPGGDTGSDGTNTWTLGDGGTIVGNNVGFVDAFVGVMIGFGNNVFSDEINWVDVTGDVRTLSFDRGRFYETDRMDAGTASLELENFDGKYNPHNTASLYYPNVTPNVPIRIRAVTGGVLYPLWQGFVNRWPVTHPGNINSLVNIACSDLFKLLARASAAQPDRLTSVLSLNPVAVWRFTGSGTDDSSEAGTHDLTFSGSPTTGVTGAWTNDEAVGFDGVDDYATVANEVDVERPSLDRSYEIWFNATPSGGGGAMLDMTSGSNTLLTIFHSGITEAVTWFVNNAGVADSVNSPDGSAPYGAWNHVVVTDDYDGSTYTRRLYLNNVLRRTTTGVPNITAAVTTIIGYFVSVGGSQFDGDISEMAVYPTALTAADVDFLYNSQFEAYETQRTDERIAYLASDSDLGLGAAYVNLDLQVGQTIISGPNSPINVTVLEAMQVASDTERGALFIAGNGALTFQDRHYRIIEMADPVTTFDQTEYLTLDIAKDDALIANDVRVAPSGTSPPFVATDATSIAENGRATLSATIYPEDPNEAFDHAHFLLGQYADPELRISRFLFDIDQAKTAALLALIFGAELSNRYQITAPLAGDDLDVEMFLEHISHTITLDKHWTVEWQLSPAEAGIGSYWLLGVAGFSELGVTTVLGY